MSPDKFLIHFYKIADAPNGVQRLREMILQLAVQGKLVPQDENDEPASVLLEKIQAEKERLIQEGKIKRQKPLPAITEEEKPFELPKGWEWVRLGDLISVMDSGWSPACLDHPSTNESFWGVLKTTSVQSMRFLSHENKELPEKLTPKPQYEVQAGDILITRAGPKNRVGISCLVESTRTRLMISDKIIRFHLILNTLKERYIVLCLHAGATAEYLEEAKSGMAESQVNISQDKLKLAPIPLCSDLEQVRILAKVDSLLSLCDQLEALQTQRTQLNHNTRQAVLDQLSNAQSPLDLQTAWQRLQTHLPRLFTEPEHIKSLRDAILQLAVQGKLVPQDENDEPAAVLLAKIQAEKERLIQEGKIKRQKPLPAITEEEKPFELPKGWEWVRFDDLALHSEAGWSPTCEAQPRDRNKWGILKVSAVTWGKFKPEENKELPANLEPRPEYEVKAGDFLISRANTAELVARAVIVPKDAPERLMLSDKIIRFVFASDVNKHFINLVNSSGFARTYYAAVAGGTSSSMKNVSREQIRKLAFALPPEKEILSILKKYSALNNLCDQLESKLTQTRQTQEQFALTATAMS